MYMPDARANSSKLGDTERVRTSSGATVACQDGDGVGMGRSRDLVISSRPMRR